MEQVPPLGRRQAFDGGFNLLKSTSRCEDIYLCDRLKRKFRTERQAQPPRSSVRATDSDLLEEVLPSF